MSHCSVTHSGDGIPTPSTSSSGAVRGIDVASDAVEASRIGRQGAGDAVGDIGPELFDVDLAVGHLRVGRPERADERRTGRLTGHEDLGRLAGHLGRRVGQPDHRDPDVRAFVEEPSDTGGIGRQSGVEHDHDPRPAAAGDLALGTRPAEVEHLEEAAQQRVGFGTRRGDVRAGQRRHHRPRVRQPFHPRAERAVADRSDEGEILRAVQAGGLDHHRRGDTVHDVVGAVQPHDAAVGQIDGDRHPVHLVGAAQRRARLFTEVVIAAARQLDLERGGRRSEPGAEPQEVGTVAAARPQVDRAEFGAARQLGQVGRGADPLDPFRFDERVELAAPGDQTLPEVRELVMESLPPRSLVLDRVGDHHQRRHQREREELHLFREREQGETRGEWSEHGEQLEPPLVPALGDRAELGRLDGRDHRRTVRRPLELDLAELVDPLALGAHEPPERQAGATEPDHVGLPGDRRLGDLAVVHRHAVLRVGQRGDRHRPVVAHGEFGMAARHRRVAEVDVRLVVAPDRVRAGHQDVARSGIGTGQRIDGDRLGRDRADRPHRPRRADHEFVAGHDAHVADRGRRFEHRPGALQRERRGDRRIRRRRERRGRGPASELPGERAGKVVHGVRRLDVDDEVVRLTVERSDAQDQFHRLSAVSQMSPSPGRPPAAGTIRSWPSTPCAARS